MRKITLAVTILACMVLIPFPLHARGGHGGFHGGHRLGGHGGFGHGRSHHGHFGHRHFGHFGHGNHHHGHFSSSFFPGFGFGALALSPFVIYPYYAYPYYVYPYASYPSAAEYGNLEIQVAPEDVEIYVDGRFIGLARDFKGQAMVSVLSGNHVVEVRYNGSSSTTNVYVAPGSKSVVSGEFKPNPNNPQPPQGFSQDPPSSTYRYFPTVYHQKSAGLLKLNADPKESSIYINGKLLAPAEQLDTGVIGLPSGSHSIEVSMPGYTSYSGKVYITEDAINELKVRLERDK